MNVTLDALEHEALVLPAEQRVALACRLLVSVDSAPDTGADAALDPEIAERLAWFDSGETEPVKAADVVVRLRQIAQPVGF